MTRDMTGASPTFIAFAPVFYSLLCFSQKIGTNTRSLCTLLLSVVLSLYIAKAEQRLCTVILVKVSFKLFIAIWYILLMTRKGNTPPSRGNCTLIHLSSTFSKTTRLVGAFAINFCPCRLEDELDSTAFTSEHAEKNPLEIKFGKDIVESYKPIVWADPRPISMLQNVSYLSNNHLFLLHILLCGLGVYT